MLSNKEKYERYKPKKFLGQNFLVDDNITRKIIASAAIEEGDNIVEIGPGQGALTKHLVRENCNYIAVELDKGICEQLKRDYGEKIKLIEGDFLKLNYEKDLKKLMKGRKPLKVIGNIPYKITSEILFKLFGMKEMISTAVLMMQKEVAERLKAKRGTKEYGILGVQTGLNTEVKVLFNVPPTAFFPKPKVYSSVVRLVMKEERGGLMDRELFVRIVRESFGQRRKVMRNSLKNLLGERNISLDEINFDFSRRPESVSVDEFIELTNEISRKK